jgi:4-amino-4-deoxy-L-arabinose transferase-like glycosyltransferase
MSPIHRTCEDLHKPRSAAPDAPPGDCVSPHGFRGLLRPRELAVWGGCLAVVCVLLAVTGFESRDPDSAFYAVMTNRLASGPAAGWIAPEWGGLWNGTGLWQEHPIGIYLVPIAVAKLGFPGAQAAYAVGIAAGLACLLLMARLAAATGVDGAGRAALVLLQLVPAAFVFRVRANHEYPMLLCLLAAIVALDGVRRSWLWTLGVVAAVTAALLIKGVFVALVLLGAGLWALVNPLRAPGSTLRPFVALGVAVVCAALVALGYDALYREATGTTFWGGYWRRQLGPVAEAAPGAGVLDLAYHALFYVAHLAWLSAPWGAALVGLAVMWATGVRARWRQLPPSLRGATLFALAYAAVSILMLSPSGRFAERYLFSPFFVSAAVGVAAACYQWPAIPAAIARLDRRIPALPALLWLVLIVGRLGLGPLLPRPRFW